VRGGRLTLTDQHWHLYESAFRLWVNEGLHDGGPFRGKDSQ
jgi:hypothetical protein